MKITELKINEANPRYIVDEKMEKLVRSIESFPKMMELRPIIIDDKGTILGGNMRYRALVQLGYKEVPDGWVKRASDLTESEKREFIIKDNIGFGAWDMDMLANEWDEVKLDEWGLDYAFITPQVDEVEDINETYNFIVQCESVDELEELQGMMATSGSKITMDKFRTSYENSINRRKEKPQG